MKNAFREADPRRPENDPMVIACFEEQRTADDIVVVFCSCGFWNYYNEGSHCDCRNCGANLMPYIEADESITMADYWTDAPYPCDVGS